MKISTSLQAFFQVTRTFFGLLAWLGKEYIRELKGALERARSRVQAQSAQVSKVVHPALTQWIDALSQWEKSVLLLYYQEGLDFASIALKTGMDVREVVKIHQNLLGKMKNLVHSEASAEETTGTVV